jgi:anti-sigma factor RsiW
MSVRDLVSLTCKEIVELVTEYQCDALDSADRVRVEQHLFGCTWCMTYLKQMDRTIALTAQLQQPAAPEPVPVDTRQLAALFRTWQAGRAKGPE